MNTKVTMAQITSITVSGVAPNNIVPSFSSVANRSSGNEKASQGDLFRLSPEEQRLVDLCRTKRLSAVVEELQKF